MGLFGLWPDRSGMPIGVDIGTGCVRMIQLRRRGGSLELQAAARAPLPPASGDLAAQQSSLSNLLATLRRSHPFVGQRCVSALSPALTPARSLRLPQMPESESDQAIRWEAKDRLGFDPTDGQVAYFRSGEVRRGSEAKDEYLLFGASSETLRSHLGLLKAAGFKSWAIDLQPCAILRSVGRCVDKGSGAPMAVLDIGEHGSQFMIVQNDRFAFYKNIEVGHARFNQAVVEKLGVSADEAIALRTQHLREDEGTDDETSNHLRQALLDATRPLLEELAKELDMCLRYFGVTFRGTRPESVLVPGANAFCNRSREILTNGVGIKCEDVQPLRGIGGLNAGTRPDRSAEWAVAAGLSLYPPGGAVQEAAA